MIDDIEYLKDTGSSGRHHRHCSICGRFIPNTATQCSDGHHMLDPDIGRNDGRIQTEMQEWL